MVKNVKIVIILVFKSKLFLPIFRLYQKNTPTICLILHQFNLYILLMYGKKLVTIKIFLLNFFLGGGRVKMCDKMAISAYIFEKSRKCPIFKVSNQSL